MTTIVLISTSTIGILGLCVVAWSIYDTRKKHFSEYVARKRKND